MSDIGSSNERLIITLDGENNVDINLLVNLLNGVSESYRNMIYAKSPQAGVLLKIEAFNKGSFEVVITSAISMAPSIIPVAQSVLSNVKLFLDIVKLKNDLKGYKPKEIIETGDEAKVINQNGEVHYHNCEVVNLYMNNPLIDKGLTDTFNALLGDKTRKAISLKSNNKNVVINEQDYENMSANLIEIKDANDSKYLESEITAELLLKKPDLLGESKLQFLYEGKTISTSIEDKTFLHKIKNGEIKTLYAHVRVPVKMKIEVNMNDKLEIVSKKYTVLKVIGDIIEPESYEQLQMT